MHKKWWNFADEKRGEGLRGDGVLRLNPNRLHKLPTSYVPIDKRDRNDYD